MRRLWPGATVVLLVAALVGCAALLPLPRGLVASREYLLRGREEDSDYGLIGYVIFTGSPGTERDQQRYEALYAAYRSLPPPEDFEALGRDRADLAVLYWPLDEGNTNRAAWMEARGRTDYFIARFDYARARLILSCVEGLRGPGPFILGHAEPIVCRGSAGTSLSRRDVLALDLSRVHETDFREALRLFQERIAGDPDTWRRGFDMERIRLSLRMLLLSYSDTILSLVDLVQRPAAIR